MTLKNDPENKNTNRDKISANIGLSLSSTNLETSPGQSIEITLKIKNRSIIVDRFHIKAEGLDPNWWTLSIPTFACFPGDECESKLIIHPPKEAEAIAGGYSFKVGAISEANPQEETVVAAFLILRSFVTWEIDVSPTKFVGHSGTYRITARNNGNTDTVLLLDGKDAEEALIFDFSQDKMSIPAGGTTQVKLVVYPKKGEQKKLYIFQIAAKYVGPSQEVKMSIGQLEYLPQRRFPLWLVPAILSAVGIILIALGITAGMYRTTTLYIFTSYPYKSYMVPLIASGTVLIIAAGIIGFRKKKFIK